MDKPDTPHWGTEAVQLLKDTEGIREGRKADNRQVQFSDCIGEYGHLKLMNIKIAKQEFMNTGMKALPKKLVFSPARAYKQLKITLFERNLRS